MALESFGEVVSINDQIENSEYHNDSLTFFADVDWYYRDKRVSLYEFS